MKKLLAFILSLTILLQGFPGLAASNAEDAMPPDSEAFEPCCAPDPELIEELHSALLAQKAETFQEDYGVATYTLRPHYGATTLMPSVGTVKMLVLPIAFSDYPQFREGFDPELEAHRLFDPYDPDKLPADQSTRGFYYQASNQRLEITRAVMPIYDEPLPRTD